jgi:hypothetical protein
VLEFTAMTLNLEIHLSRGIIENGNYADVGVGERRKICPCVLGFITAEQKRRERLQ